MNGKCPHCKSKEIAQIYPGTFTIETEESVYTDVKRINLYGCFKCNIIFFREW